jgi:hypothetical protein
MDVEQWKNNTERQKEKYTEETFLSTASSATYYMSTRLVLSWVTAGRFSRLSCGVATTNRLSSAGHFKGISVEGARSCYRKEH